MVPANVIFTKCEAIIRIGFARELSVALNLVRCFVLLFIPETDTETLIFV